MVYIASAYTIGDPVTNVRDSLVVADRLMVAGYIPVTPLLSHFWHFLSPKPYEVWIDYDLHLLARCDILLRLPGKSSGADREVAFANSHGIPVFNSVENLLGV